MSYIDEIANAIQERIDSDRLPEKPEVTGLFRLYALLVLTTGEETTRENVHDAWAIWMLGRDADHKSIEPFDELDHSTQSEDEPFRRAIIQVARTRRA